jgi:hypothetical protein
MMKKKLAAFALKADHLSWQRTNNARRRFMQQELTGRGSVSGCHRRERPMSDSETTTDHNVIKKWAEERDGRPATVRATEENGHAGVLRIDFGPEEERLEVIEWDEFFRKFDQSDLAFLYQDRTKDGKLSRFHKFVRR